MNRNFLFHIFCVCIICTGIISGCNQDEDTLEPSEHLPMKYTLPQGDAEYDDRILEFYKTFDTFILYDYDTIDPFWNVQSVINTTKDYHIVLPKNENIEVGVNTLFDLWLGLYSDEFLQGRLPRYLFLADSVYYWSTSFLKPGVVELKTESCTTTATNMTIAGINESLQSMTATEKDKLKQSLNNTYWAYLFNQGKFEVPEALKNIDYSTIKTSTAAYAAGLFHGTYSKMTVEEDFKKSIEWMMKTSQTMIDYYFRTKPAACKERCTLFVDEMKRLYNLDLEVLSGRTLPHTEKAE